MKEIKAPHEYDKTNKLPSIFLAGSIEMDTAEHRQKRIIADLTETLGIAYNPRRDQRDTNREQSTNNQEFVKQVTWEEEHLIKSDLVLFYFDPTAKSPITIGELNLIRGMQKNAVVLCPDGFWRKGNIDIACMRSKNHITQVQNYKELIEYIQNHCNTIINDRYTPNNIKTLQDNQIFVFGSNKEGKHYGGSAKVAHEQFGAERGVGQGPTGQCYAIPTMERPHTEAGEVIKCTIEDITQAMQQFFTYTRSQTHQQFLLTRIGCGVAGRGIPYMKDLFWKFYNPEMDTNIIYPIEFENI